MRVFLIIFFLLLGNYADACKLTSTECIEGAQTRHIAGMEVHRECWKYKNTYDCYGDKYKDHCSALRGKIGCEQVDSVCTKHSEQGKCLEYKDTFICGDLLSNKVREVKLLNSEYTVVKDELDVSECKDRENNPNCYEAENKCIEGPEMRVINGKEVYKDCWAYEMQYTCFTGGKVSDCKKYEKDKSCTKVDEECFSKAKDGTCKHLEKQYKCKKRISISSESSLRKYCLENNCKEISPSKPNGNFSKAISSLSMLAGLKGEFVGSECKDGDCRVFKGMRNGCTISPIDSINCCTMDGWAMGIANCDADEERLAEQRAKGLCHHVGSYCSDKLLGVCIEKTQSYCCFNSKLARVINEQVRAQLGISWGRAKSPNCSALKLSDLQRVDLSKANLSELYSDIKPRMKVVDVEEVGRRVNEHYRK